MLRSGGGGKCQYTREQGSVNRLVGQRARLSRWLPETSRSKHDTCVQRTVTPSSRRGPRVHNLLLRQVPISFTTPPRSPPVPKPPSADVELAKLRFFWHRWSLSLPLKTAAKTWFTLKGHLSTTICDNLPPTIPFLILSTFFQRIFLKMFKLPLILLLPLVAHAQVGKCNSTSSTVLRILWKKGHEISSHQWQRHNRTPQTQFGFLGNIIRGFTRGPVGGGGGLANIFRPQVCHRRRYNWHNNFISAYKS